ncbi:hypothetical protein ACIQRW_26790 [Streptomyces sp. NPDC091287]|uniref:hypothetical protein n=1 Tax=Streptomyces sp. NPDC091287 TaxID=3365988 RepID=UPI0038082832
MNHIPPPDPDREPLKVNIFERMSGAAAQLLPMFPYDDAGSVVPCGAVMSGGPDEEYGHFFHGNSVAEVVVVYGSDRSMLSSGQIFATQPLHGVNSFLRDEKDPEGFAVMTITQHQSEDGDQRETLLARCQKCKAELVRVEYDATPYGVEGHDPTQFGAEDDRVRPFATIAGSEEFVRQRNSDDGRTCKECEHVNPPFPAAQWGWQRQNTQTRAVNRAYHALIKETKS